MCLVPSHDAHGRGLQASCGRFPKCIIQLALPWPWRLWPVLRLLWLAHSCKIPQKLWLYRVELPALPPLRWTSVQPSLVHSYMTSHGPGHTCYSSVVAAISLAATMTTVSDSWVGGLAAWPWWGWVGWHGSASWPRAGEALIIPERLDEGSCSCPPSDHFPNKPNTGCPRVGELGLCAPPGAQRNR